MAHHTSPLSTVVVFFVLAATSVAGVAPVPRRGSAVRPFTKIYAFGDSFTDTGNTHSETGPTFFGGVSSPPYGSTYFHHPTNRYSDGRLVIDFVAHALSLPFVPPYRNRSSDFSHGVNFAVAGSTAVNHRFFVRNNVSLDTTPESLGTQFIWFQKFLQTQKKVKGNPPSMDGLFWVGEIGVNDYAYTLASTVPATTVRTLAINKVATFVQALLEKGAKYIVVQGLPMIGCLPLTLVLTSPDDRDTLGCSASANQMVQTHNSLLKSELQKLRQKYPMAFISYADYEGAHRMVMTDPASFGLKETIMACCGSGGPPYNFELFSTCGSLQASTCRAPSKYVNWDGVHLTEASYRAIAELLLHHGYCQPSFDQLLRSKRRGL